ncbi:MAG: hypothetical protein J5I53_04435 [Bradyrhizobiaceae bacterium]|nr:hypothetical protein [Bradyrhizobiaceae bacterium]
MPASRSTLISSALVILLVVLVTASSFGISRVIIDNRIEEALPLAQQRQAQRDELARVEQQQALVAARQDTLSHLLEVLETKLIENPADSMLLISAGNIAYDLQQYGKAATFYSKFLDTFHGPYTAVRIDYGFAVFQSGNQDRGLGILRSVLKSEPRNQTALFNLAYMYQQLNNVDSTRALLTACRDADAASAIGKNAAAILQQLPSGSSASAQ